MSAIGQILDAVETRVKALLAKVTEHEKAQDKRMDDLEKRVAALEAPAPSAAPKATTAKATAARASGTASSTK